MANTKEYTIKINGLQQSIDAVDSLNKQLDKLEQRMNAINATKASSGGGSSSSRASSAALSEEERVQKEINKLKEQGAQLDAKIAASQDEIYKRVDATKQLYKETLADQKAIAAQERLTANAYSNTMVGMKQQLADIKAVIQTTDLGDGDVIKKMTEQANELTNKLKKMEEAYGQFGRNVGNYASAFDGMQKLSVTVGGVTREFNSAREASKTLKNELIGLEAAGSGNTEVAKELRSEYYKLQSAMDDATKSSKAMDEAMDIMQSMTAMASIGQGLKGFFGIDDSEIQRSIQRLVALQNVLNGIETIRKQMETSEGIGMLLTKGSGNIDKMVAGITGAKIATEGLTMGSKAATVAVRGLSMALKAVGIGLVLEAINLLVQGIEWVTEKLTKWVKGDADLIKEEKLLDAQLDYTNKKLEERNSELSKAYYQGVITQEEMFRKQLEATTTAINEQINALRERAALEGDSFSRNINNGITGSIDMSAGGGTQHISNLKELTTLWKFYADAVLEGKDAMSKLSTETGNVSAWFRGLIYTLDDTKDDLVQIGQIAIGEFLSKYQHAMETMQSDTKAGERELAELKKQMDDNEMLRTIFMNLDQYVPVEAFRKRIQQIINLIRGVKTEMGDLEQRTVEQVLRSEQLKIDAMKDGAAKRQAQRDLDKKKELADATLTAEDKANIEKKYQQRRLREEKAANQKSQSEAKKNAREQLEAEKDLANLRISNMKEGLNKVLKQLEEERKLRLAKVETDGKLVAERQAEINILYDKKILEAKKEWAEKVEKQYKDMWDNIYSYSLEIARKIGDLMSQAIDINSQNLEYKRSQTFSPDIASYGVQGTNQLSRATQEELGLEEEKSKRISALYSKRIIEIKQYWNERIDWEKTAIQNLLMSQVQIEEEEYQKEKRDREKRWNEQQKLQSDWYEKRREELRGLAKDEKWTQEELDKELLNTDKEYYKAAEALLAQYQLDERAIEEKHSQNKQKLEQESVNKVQKLYGDYYRNRLQELRDFQTAVSNLESKQPVLNSWGITDFKRTNENNRNLLESYRRLVSEITKLKSDLQKQLDEKEITFDDFQSANRELDAFADNVGQKMDKVKRELSVSEQIGQFIRDIQQYVQAVGQSVQQIFSAIWDMQDNAFDDEQDEIDKMNDLLDKKLDEQQEIIDKHKSAIDSIEDELATSRGDRRQHLIDQLNAEMEAQRRAAAEEKKLQKEKEAQEKKQDELAKRRAKAEYKRQQIQAIVSGALAVVNALATQPFMPVGIAMAALAAATTAAQIAIMASNKPYAKGGLLEGKSHAQGGIPIPGTGIEVEGKEYVIRKKSTSQNIDLLDYINRSERKLNLDDFIDFYGGKVKRNLTSMSPGRKFADGGALPTLRGDIDINDRLISAFEDYSNRPTVVSVVDINDRQAAVKNVQVLAGVEQ